MSYISSPVAKTVSNVHTIARHISEIEDKKNGVRQEGFFDVFMNTNVPSISKFLKSTSGVLSISFAIVTIAAAVLVIKYGRWDDEKMKLSLGKYIGVFVILSAMNFNYMCICLYVNVYAFFPYRHCSGNNH